MKKLNFAIISCGGTISMEPNKNGVLEPKKTVNQIISQVNLSDLSGSINIPKDKIIELFKLDSSDINHLHWTQIVNKIEEIQDKCDGILVFHGTDTMAYSATAVGLALAQKIKIPIVFTGSQSPIVETGTDGKSNVERSLLILERAANDKLTECMIFFGDEAYRAVNCRKRSEADFKAFESPRVKPLYIIGGLGIRAIWPGRKAADVENSKKAIGFNLKNSFANGVVVLPIIPGLEPNLLMTIAKEKTTSAIILYSLGTGNVPSLKGGFSLIPSIHKIIEDLKKPIIVASPFVGGSTNMEVYMPGVLAKEAGAINAGKMTAEATVVKVRLLLAQSEYNSSMEFLSSALATDFAGEGATE